MLSPGPRFTGAVALLAATILQGSADAVASPAAGRAVDPLLVVLTDTGRTRDNVPVLERHPDPGPLARVLTRGFSGRLLRLYRQEQTYLHGVDGRPVEPAYLLLSRNQGGFGKQGFYLGEADKRGTGYVDLPADGGPATGAFGTVDQIFPHELLHVIVHQLSGPPPATPTNQIHEVGTQTNRVYAYQEGFAEAMQILAVDDDDADPATASLRAGAGRAVLRRAGTGLREYRDVLASRVALAPFRRLGFLLWYSQAAQAQRYFAVKGDEFAYEPDIPRHLLTADDPYEAYLLDNILSGTAGTRARPATRLVAIEGVVSHLLWRWLTDPALQNGYAEEALYRRFGTSRKDVDPRDNAMLKLFHVLHSRKPVDIVTLVDAYRSVFPRDAAAVDAVVTGALAGQRLPRAPQLWMTNDGFTVGISVLDQYRSVPVRRTFDLNAASLPDLLSVPGVGCGLAEAIASGGPYREIDDLGRVDGMSPAVLERFRAMAASGRAQEVRSADDVESQILGGSLFGGYLIRCAAFLLLAAGAGAASHRAIRGAGWVRTALCGLAVAVVGLVPLWVLPLVSGRWYLLLGPFLLVTVLTAGWDLAWHRSPRRAGLTTAAWFASLLVCLAMTRTWC
jgi:hypothetical protein